jgi:aminoglycoside 6'-N-acetyltransferase I
MRFNVRQMRPADRVAWARMRAELWPDAPSGEHATEIDALLAGVTGWGFVAQTHDGAAVGFAEITIRPFANGCDSRPVPFLEGIWVDAPFRRQGVGARLVAHIEAFVAARGFCEIGSDALVENHTSHAAHRGWGFCETERIVHFRKFLSART